MIFGIITLVIIASLYLTALDKGCEVESEGDCEGPNSSECTVYSPIRLGSPDNDEPLVLYLGAYKGLDAPYSLDWEFFE